MEDRGFLWTTPLRRGTAEGLSDAPAAQTLAGRPHRHRRLRPPEPDRRLRGITNRSVQVLEVSVEPVPGLGLHLPFPAHTSHCDTPLQIEQVLRRALEPKRHPRTTLHWQRQAIKDGSLSISTSASPTHVATPMPWWSDSSATRRNDYRTVPTSVAPRCGPVRDRGPIGSRPERAPRRAPSSGTCALATMRYRDR
jgi:hypothetical protein